MRVLVTGGAGFIGSHVVEHLVAAGHAVTVVDNLATGRRERVPASAPLYEVDILAPALGDVFREARPDAVVHLAAQVSVPHSMTDPLGDARTNVQGTLSVLEAVVAAGVRRVVYASSAAVYGNPQYLPIDEAHPTRPLSPYGQSKLIGENYVTLYGRLHKVQTVCLRYANVYGPRQDARGEAGVVTLFAQALAEGRPATLYGSGQQTRDFVYVGDIARANGLALLRGDGEVLNIGSGKPTSIRNLWSAMSNLDGGQLAIEYADARPGDIEHSWFDTRRAAEALGWRPRVALRSGLRQTLQFMKEQT